MNDYNQFTSCNWVEAPTSCFLLATTRRRLQPLSLFPAPTGWKLQLPNFLLVATRRRPQPLAYTTIYWMEAPTSWFSGIDLEMATTTYLAPPCHPIMQIGSCSIFVCNLLCSPSLHCTSPLSLHGHCPAYFIPILLFNYLIH